MNPEDSGKIALVVGMVAVEAVGAPALIVAAAVGITILMVGGACAWYLTTQGKA